MPNKGLQPDFAEVQPPPTNNTKTYTQNIPTLNINPIFIPMIDFQIGTIGKERSQISQLRVLLQIWLATVGTQTSMSTQAHTENTKCYTGGASKSW